MTDPDRKPVTLAELFAASFDAAALVGRTQSPAPRPASAANTDALRRVTASTTLRGPKQISLAESR